jgi:hypothetical protein
MRLRPDHTLVIRGDWPAPADQVKGLAHELETLARIAGTVSSGNAQGAL